MLPTPDTSHVSFSTIYEPAEDSFLLLDTLSSAAEAAWLTQRFPDQSPSPLIAEIGTGSGVVLGFVAANAKTICGRDDVFTIGIDVNPNACKATSQTVLIAMAERNSQACYLGAVCADLCSALKPASVDVLILNPPYVPTEALAVLLRQYNSHSSAYDRDSKLLSLSYAGGMDGMEVTNRLLRSLPAVMSPRGVAYVLLCAQNKPEEVKARLRHDGGGGSWHVETVSRSGKAAGWEKLEILRIWRT